MLSRLQYIGTCTEDPAHHLITAGYSYVGSYKCPPYRSLGPYSSWPPYGTSTTKISAVLTPLAFTSFIKHRPLPPIPEAWQQNLRPLADITSLFIARPPTCSECGNKTPICDHCSVGYFFSRQKTTTQCIARGYIPCHTPHIVRCISTPDIPGNTRDHSK